MDYQTMTQLKRLKNYPIIAIVLAISLSLLIAAIAYFATLDNKPAVKLEDSKLNDERSISTSILKRKPAPIDNLVAPDNNKEISAQSYKSKDKEIIKNPSSVKQTTDSTTNNINNRKKTADNNQQSPLEYELKQTEDYQQLDADIDQDNEQLAELIDEVKKRNQSQIQQHQLPQSETNDMATNDADANSTNTKNIRPTAQIEYDYPITPITSLSTAEDSRPATKDLKTDE